MAISLICIYGTPDSERVGNWTSDKDFVSRIDDPRVVDGTPRTVAHQYCQYIGCSCKCHRAPVV